MAEIRGGKPEDPGGNFFLSRPDAARCEGRRKGPVCEPDGRRPLHRVDGGTTQDVEQRAARTLPEPRRNENPWSLVRFQVRTGRRYIRESTGFVAIEETLLECQVTLECDR